MGGLREEKFVRSGMGVETGGGNKSETGSVIEGEGKQISSTRFGASLTADFDNIDK